MGDDPELAAIRAKRMQELQGMQGGASQQEEQVAQRKTQMNSILNQVLDQQARARLNTIMCAKPEKGQQMESIICQMATQGQIPGKLAESDLINLAERINAQTQKTSKVKFDRRRINMDSDDDE
ncbi:unnamed protein product [Meganyctiphanes norvegica]|uniref:Programmed cell death protein 5 n=1 Tax=Meganyctiphanes norvegica TaxID=48144 RepID=A0AAV2QDK1_MEGNR